MNDRERIDELINNSYQIIGNVFPLTRFTKGNSDVKNFYNVFNVITPKKKLLNPSNQNKSLIILRDLSTNDQVEIITNEEEAIFSAKKQIEYQRAPIGTLLRFTCVALGGSSSYQRIFYLNQLIPSLDGLWGWKFELQKEIGSFSVKIRIKSTTPYDIEVVKSKVQHLLDYLAIRYEVGFHIQHTSISPIRRIEPTISVGPVERMLDSISFSEEEIDQFLRLPSEILNSVRGLNQSYIENCMPSRLAILWSAFESAFNSKPNRLLKTEEIKELKKIAEKIPSLIEDSERLEKFKSILSDPNRLPLKGRNKRMAEPVALAMNISEDAAYEKISNTSRIRGKHLHNLKDNWTEIEEAEKFLQEVLKKFVKRFVG